MSSTGAPAADAAPAGGPVAEPPPTSTFVRSLADRWAFPGPRVRARPAALGSIGGAALRFAAGLGQSPRIRRNLAGPVPIAPARSERPVRPPLWWYPAERASDTAWAAVGTGRSPTRRAMPASGPAGARRTVPGSLPASVPGRGTRSHGVPAAVIWPVTEIPARTLRRAAGTVPSVGGHQPGATSSAMAGKPVAVRRMPEVTFSGSMAGAARKLVPPRPGPAAGGAGRPGGASAGGAPPGTRPGDGAAATAVPRPRSASAARPPRAIPPAPRVPAPVPVSRVASTPAPGSTPARTDTHPPGTVLRSTDHTPAPPAPSAPGAAAQPPAPAVAAPASSPARAVSPAPSLAVPALSPVPADTPSADTILRSTDPTATPPATTAPPATNAPGTTAQPPTPSVAAPALSPAPADTHPPAAILRSTDLTTAPPAPTAPGTTAQPPTPSAAAPALSPAPAHTHSPDTILRSTDLTAAGPAATKPMTSSAGESAVATASWTRRGPSAPMPSGWARRALALRRRWSGGTSASPIPVSRPSSATAAAAPTVSTLRRRWSGPVSAKPAAGVTDPASTSADQAARPAPLGIRPLLRAMAGRLRSPEAMPRSDRSPTSAPDAGAETGSRGLGAGSVLRRSAEVQVRATGGLPVAPRAIRAGRPDFVADRQDVGSTRTVTTAWARRPGTGPAGPDVHRIIAAAPVRSAPASTSASAQDHAGPFRTIARPPTGDVSAETSTGRSGNAAGTDFPRNIRRIQTGRISAQTAISAATFTTPLAVRMIGRAQADPGAAGGAGTPTAPAARWSTTTIRPATTTRGTVTAPPRTRRRSQDGRVAAETVLNRSWNTTGSESPGSIRRTHDRHVPAEMPRHRSGNIPDSDSPRNIRRSQTGHVSAQTGFLTAATFTTPLALRMIGQAEPDPSSARRSGAPAARWTATTIRPATTTRAAVSARPRAIGHSQDGRVSAETPQHRSGNTADSGSPRSIRRTHDRHVPAETPRHRSANTPGTDSSRNIRRSQTGRISAQTAMSAATFTTPLALRMIGRAQADPGAAGGAGTPTAPAARWTTTTIRPATTTRAAVSARPRAIGRSQHGRASAGAVADTRLNRSGNTTDAGPPRSVRRRHDRHVPAETPHHRSGNTPDSDSPRNIRRSQSGHVSAPTGFLTAATFTTPLAVRMIGRAQPDPVSARRSGDPAARWATTTIRPATTTRAARTAPPRAIGRSQDGRASAGAVGETVLNRSGNTTGSESPRSVRRTHDRHVPAETPHHRSDNTPGTGSPRNIRRSQTGHVSAPTGFRTGASAFSTPLALRTISRARAGRGPATTTATATAAAATTSTSSTTGTGGATRRASAAEVAGLLLRQVIPAAAVVDAATAGVLRRMPPAPPTGAPRLGSPRLGGHRGDRAPTGPDVPRSADPNWSFTGARGRRALSGAAIGDRAARPITLTGTDLTSPNQVPNQAHNPAVNPGGHSTAGPSTTIPGPAQTTARRGSLVDLLPASLFERARAGLADPTGGAAPASGRLGPIDARPREVAVSSPIDDGTPRQQQIAEALTPREWDELVDIIVDRLEDRVLDELARRGRRFTPGVF